MKISINNLGKKFNREWIFRELTYEFKAGNTYALVGPNGSGKSTLLQILWGQLPPSQGTLIYSLGLQEIPAEEIFRSLSIATSYMELIEEFTLREMVRFHFRFKKIRNGGTPDDVLERLELHLASDKYISNFSSGMRQRLKLGLAFYSETPLIFLDEPTTNLDSKSIEWYWSHLTSLPQDALIFIASNQEHEYPQTAKKINISAYK
jgi:ABC-type multidrug transport system ATPase subunit